MTPDRGLSNKQHSGVKGKKTRLTYALTTNADGSEKLPPIVIGKARRPRAFNKKTGDQLGFHYRNNAKAWMTSSLYGEWIKQWDTELSQKGRKILLLQDNFSGHIVPDGLQSIHVENFEPNLTAHVQPEDQGIIRCFKAHYRARFIQRAINRYDEGITTSAIYDINQLQAMRLADTAWKEVDVTTIRNCWKKAGILPEFAPIAPTQPSLPISALIHDATIHEDPLTHAEKLVVDALDDLESTGALQATNRMSIEALLNPEGERETMDESTDEEIYQAVMDARNARENIDQNGGDDADSDDGPVQARPTVREVLQAAATLNRYIDELDDPIARKLETTLGSFKHQLRLNRAKSMKSTVLTDFFSHRV